MVIAIVLAAGRSTRMGTGANKQFLDLLGKPLVHHSLVAFQQCPDVTGIVLVRRPDYAGQAGKLVQAGRFAKVIAFADGGVERQNSVSNGLDQCPPGTEIVCVHDGARPLITPELISSTIRSARANGTGIAATKIVDTIKEARPDRTVERTVDRTKLWAVQTPQTIRYSLLRQAYDEVFKAGLVVTDEAAAVERLGHPVHLVETPFLNIKVTMPGDLATAEALLRHRR
jgi:2-C-methyl-D-erythritol 4-phosphate cytidylyltransferase